MRKLIEYSWHTGKLPKPMRLLVVSDLHNDRFDDIIPLLSSCDALLLPGDLADAYRKQYENAIAFLAAAAKILPTFVSVGNHDARLKDFRTLRAAGEGNRRAVFVQHLRTAWRAGDRRLVPPAAVRAAGYAARVSYGGRLQGADEPPARGLLSTICGTRTSTSCSSGHAHGGQWRICGRGVYCVRAGDFPQVYPGRHGRMIISAGASNRVAVPRDQQSPRNSAHRIGLDGSNL